MQIQVTEQTKNGVELEINGKQRVCVVKTSTSIIVLCVNASHKAFRGAGRSFQSFDAAIAAYKSAGVQEAIKTASGLLAVA